MAQSDSNSNPNIKININNNNDNGSSPSFNKCEENFLSKLKQKVWLAPVISGILVPILCVMSYLIALDYHKVYPIWPYVSDTAQYPAAGYFSEIIDFISIFGLIFVIARYKQIKYYLTEVISKHFNNKGVINDDICKRLYKKNFNALIFGVIITMGGIGVGNFRSTENLLLHFLSAVPLFVSSLLYMSNQIYIGRYLYKCDKIESNVTSIRIIYYLSFIGSLGCITLSFISGYILVNKYGDKYEYSMILHWKPDMPGYLLHCIATAFEWMVLFLLFPFQTFCMGRRMKQFQYWNRVF